MISIDYGNGICKPSDWKSSSSVEFYTIILYAFTYTNTVNNRYWIVLRCKIDEIPHIHVQICFLIEVYFMATESSHCFYDVGLWENSKQTPSVENGGVELSTSRGVILGGEQSEIRHMEETIQFGHLYGLIRTMLFIEMKWLMGKSLCIRSFRRV